ncbi:MAG: hypothetical protein IID33_02235 [Planctomycetes bacterium]|nr:hypothetical protein [Planctomycetota bacterium]
MAKSTSPAGARSSGPRAENDIYTALIFIAFLFVLIATIYVAFKATTLFGSLIPPGGS